MPHPDFSDVRHMRWKRRVNKTWRLFHVELFSKNVIKEGIMNFKLMNLPISRNYNRENQSDSGLLNNWTEGFRIINAFLLGKTSRNKGRFITLNTTINMTFDPIHPSISNNVHRRMKGNQRPSVIRTQSYDLITHRIMPNCMLVSIRECKRLRRRRMQYPCGGRISGS